MVENGDIKDFRNVFSYDCFDLPIRWDGKDYVQKLTQLYDFYNDRFYSLFDIENEATKDLGGKIRYICEEIIRSVKAYLNGKPYEAFDIFNRLFSRTLMSKKYSLYDTQNDPSILEKLHIKEKSRLFRVRKVNENKIFTRSEIFHTPFSLRNKAATTRYSIAGYPSLYLSSSLELCLKEMEYEINPGRYICSRFEMSSESKARIVELGIKPKDFLPEKRRAGTKRYRLIDRGLLSNPKTIRNYYLWFPLIAACSFVRVDRSDPFAIEYVIPQLLMQSIRKMQNRGPLIGIRYFSCSSMHASELGFNYVFPTDYDGNSARFCPVLSKAFLLTDPVLLNEYYTPQNCENDLCGSCAGNLEAVE